MKMDWSKNDFSKARVGDKVWDLGRGWGAIISIVPNAKYPVAVKFDDFEFVTYTLDGHSFETDITPSLFWDEIHFEIPEPPKRKAKKTVEFWMTYANNGNFCLVTFDKNIAHKYEDNDFIVTHHVDEIEVDEE